MPDLFIIAGPNEASPFAPAENTRRALRAMRRAFADVVLENVRYGLPVIQWRDGKVVEVPAEELAPLARRILEANGEPLPEELGRRESLVGLATRSGKAWIAAMRRDSSVCRDDRRALDQSAEKTPAK